MKLQFPSFSLSRGLASSKMIHFIVVLLAVLVPCIPVIAAFSTGGYSTAIYPQVACFMKDSDAAYYSFSLMLAIINGIGVPLLIISFLTAIKVYLTCLQHIAISCLLFAVQSHDSQKVYILANYRNENSDSALLFHTPCISDTSSNHRYSTKH